ncbi:AAA family ATPase [Azospirillum picis]|uniref:Orc1-like AAA ATPase domain-containing protein n=1 Tax=Azospirillum picis TaxID=488438 RepID=A0ABU0MIG5_9PROT|nr:AAA family ATPase [Azospirillum picis]MBP2299612.1 hypothetical protein [Azospirillum picis]MDQ0533261.1 hypothetical protein [Azospirillum picis]
MDPVRNPYAPGAGTPPPELAGRADIIVSGKTALQRTAAGKPTQSQILVGLRGVGKTVLLNKLNDDAETLNYKTAFIEAREGASLPELLAPSLRSILYTLSMVENAREKARRGLMGLKGFLNGLRVTISEVEFGISIDSEAGLADSGNIEADLPVLIATIGEAAKAAGRPVALFVDEMQYLASSEFSALIMSIHRINQKQLPFMLIGAGLPQIRALAGNSKSYSERLFRFPEIGALGTEEAIQAIEKPAIAEGVTFDRRAIEKILHITERYPYFLQQWAYESWNVADGNAISLADVEKASGPAIDELDQSFFKVRFDRCTPAERKYMRALAELGRGKHRSGDIAEKLGVKVTSVAPTRNSLIRKGMIYSPSHGDTAFTVPLFDEYMKRALPDFPIAADDE